MAAVRAGVGREQAHDVIKEHAVAVALARREKGSVDDDLLERLAGDERLGLARSDIEAAVAEPMTFTGAAADQVATFVQRTVELARLFPEAAAYRPEPIL
jgi:adenylosuccinate lyase